MFDFFSPNMLKTYAQCPEKFKLKYVEGITMPVNDDIFVTGKNIHALASHYLRGENIDNMEKSLTSDEQKIWKYLKNIKYFTYKLINTEYNLSVKIGNTFFGGRLDALVFNGDRYYILDYKTGGAPKNYRTDFQTIIYLLAVKDFFKTDNISFVYLDLKNREEATVALDEELVNDYKKILNDTGIKINKEIFTPNNKNKHCTYCEYKVVCDEKILN